jgi:hypothetical protein
MCSLNPRPQPLVAAARRKTTAPCPQPPTLVTHPLSWLEQLGLLTPQKPRRAVLTVCIAEAAGNTSDVDVDQHLLNISVGGHSLPNITLADDPPPHVALFDAAYLNVSLPRASPDSSVVEE